MSANEKQVAGNHYKATIEHWDYVVANKLNYFEGQITKYVTRCRKKSGMQDLEKAKHFLEKYMEVFKLVQGHPAVAKHGYYGEKTPPPAQAESLVVERHPSGGGLFIHPEGWKEAFTVEGYHGSGNNVYQCRVCKAEVLAPGYAHAAAQHAVPCTRPRPARAG
ncbi:MAG: DUF3310 domain-containing protein [Vicinamibacterales bacterium]